MIDLPWLQPVYQRLLDMEKQDRLTHAILLQGPAGIGKRHVAQHFCAYLLCQNQQQKTACGECQACRLRIAGSHPELFDLSPEEGSQQIRIDAIRHLAQVLTLTTTISPLKIALLYPADAMNHNAANAILKTLEEPVGNTLLILVADQVHKLPITVRSRCQCIEIPIPEAATALSWMDSQSDYSQAELQQALGAAGGRPLKALELLDSAELSAFVEIETALNQLLEQNLDIQTLTQTWTEWQADDVWGWIIACSSKIIQRRQINQQPNQALYQLLQQAYRAKQLSVSAVRQDLLLNQWLIQWSRVKQA